MASLLRKRITLVWLGLVLATLLSWETVGALAADPRALGAIALAIAFVKVRYITLEFMELRGAPLVMRLFVEGWCLLVCAVVILFYWQPGVLGIA